MYKYLVLVLLLLSACSFKQDLVDTSVLSSVVNEQTENSAENIVEQDSMNLEAEKLLVQAELLCPDFTDCPKAQEALKILDDTLMLNPEFIEAYELRAICLSNLAYHQDALDDLTKVIVMRPRHDPKLQQSYLRRAYLHTLLGNKLGAKKDQEQAEKLSKK